MSQNRSEASYIIHNIVPAFAQYGYPQAGDPLNLKVAGDIKVRIGSEWKYPDLVYFAFQVPLLVVESKKPGKSMDDARDQAFSYVRFFPRELTVKGIRPKYFVTTDGATIHKVYKYIYEIDKHGELLENYEELSSLLTYEELQILYGIKAQKPKLNSNVFKDIFYNLARIYILSNDKKLTPQIIKQVVIQLYEFLKESTQYVSRQPYVSLDKYPDRQLVIRNLFSQYDWSNSLNSTIADEFKIQILRSFQGINLNQYITPTEVVAFMSNLVSFNKEDKVLDFECGSGSFIRAAVTAGVGMENILGIDIADLPYYVSKTYLALYFGITGQKIESVPIILGNGLYSQGNNWSVVISNPAGGSKYDNNGELNDIEQILKHLDGDLDLDEKKDPISEYYLSIQQAIHSSKVGGKICLILPDGLFANSSDGILRNYIAKYCRIKAIVSLPRGVFYKGTTTKTVSSGSQLSNQKMSILFCIKRKEVITGSGVSFESEEMNYPVFLASIELKDNLENSLSFILQQFEHWEKESSLNINSTLNIPKKINKLPRKTIQQKLIQPESPLLDSIDEAKIEKPKTQVVSTILSSLKDLFNK